MQLDVISSPFSMHYYVTVSLEDEIKVAEKKRRGGRNVVDFPDVKQKIRKKKKI